MTYDKLRSITLRTSNGGLTWKQQTSCSQENLESVFATGINTAFAVGYGTILKTNSPGNNISEFISNSNEISIYPNPATEKITIELLKISGLQNTNVSIYNIHGQLLMQKLFNQAKSEISITGLERGIYIVRVYNNDAVIVTKIVKQ